MKITHPTSSALPVNLLRNTKYCFVRYCSKQSINEDKIPSLASLLRVLQSQTFEEKERDNEEHVTYLTSFWGIK